MKRGELGGGKMAESPKDECEAKSLFQNQFVLVES